jgi:aminocarboxymuconate-semialdehyde decarboxylase
VVERYPAIKFFMVHGGGFAPYQAGRWQHGWHVRAEPKARLKQPPEAAIKKLYFDTILHGRPALEFLVATFGASHVLLGSDYPYDMGTLECARQVKALSIPAADRAMILGGLAQKLLGSAPSKAMAR